MRGLDRRECMRWKSHDAPAASLSSGITGVQAVSYRLEARGMLQPMARGLVIELSNRGQAAAVLQVRADHLDVAPRSTIVEPGKRLTESWDLASDGHYELTVHGPQGFLRTFKGRMHDDQQALLEAHVECHHQGAKALTLSVANFGALPAMLRIRDNYTDATWRDALSPDDVMERECPCARHDGWYDFVIASDEDGDFRWRFAGHLGNGCDCDGDVALGSVLDNETGSRRSVLAARV